MKNSLIIARREFMERWNNRSFRFMLFLGPLLLLAVIYLLIIAGNQGKSNLNVLIVDPTGLFEEKIVSHPSESITYYFYQDYVELEAFRDEKKFRTYDAMIEINEKVLINKKVFLFYRETPNVQLKMKLKFEVERRVEEVMIEQFTNLGIEDFRKIKQPLNVDFRDVNDPLNQSENEIAWVGYSLGYLMIFFLGIFGTNITRSINREKANRVSEVILASAKAHELMLGKILGILWASLLQLFFWIFIIALGLWVFEYFIFFETLGLGHLEGVQVSDQGLSQFGQSNPMMNYNTQMDLFFHRINYAFLIPNFMLFFLGTYWVYSSFFTVIGAMSGDESDGQQFVIPIWILFGISIFAGYNAVQYPDAALTQFFTFFPWTAGMVAMVKITAGVTVVSYLFLLLSWLIMVLVGAVLLYFAGRIFKNGILSFGHKLTFKLLLKWLKI